MGAYRERLLKETYGSRTAGRLREPEEEYSAGFVMFKLRFTLSLLLFAGFLGLCMTGESIGGVTADKIEAAVTDDTLYIQLTELSGQGG